MLILDSILAELVQLFKSSLVPVETHPFPCVVVTQDDAYDALVSIENAVTTKRRAEKAERSRQKALRAKERGGEESSDEEEDSDDEKKTEKKKSSKEDKPAKEGEEKKEKKSKVGSKKRKAAAAERPESEKKPKREPGKDAEGKPKQGATMGSMIGRKRRAKAGKR